MSLASARRRTKKERGGPRPSISRSDLVAGPAPAAAHLLELALRLAVAHEQEHARRNLDDGAHEERQRTPPVRLPEQLLEPARPDVAHDVSQPARAARGDDHQLRL